MALDAGLGGIRGRLCGARGYALSYAEVWFTQTTGSEIRTLADIEGRFELVGLPEGSQSISAQRGPFHTEFSVDVVAGVVRELPDALCTPAPRIAVVTGLYDHVEDVLGTLGFRVKRIYRQDSIEERDPAGSVDLIDGRFVGNSGDLGLASRYWLRVFLTDPQRLARYDMLFLNCGLDDHDIAEHTTDLSNAISNLKDFIAQGGSLYVSDWAADLIRQAFPSQIAFRGDPTLFGSSRVGRSDLQIDADIHDPVLRERLGTLSLPIAMRLDEWSMMLPVEVQPVTLRVMVTGDGTGVRPETCGQASGCETYRDHVPLTVQFSYGLGQVIYTSAHVDEHADPVLEELLRILVFRM